MFKEIRGREKKQVRKNVIYKGKESLEKNETMFLVIEIKAFEWIFGGRLQQRLSTTEEGRRELRGRAAITLKGTWVRTRRTE